MPPGSSAPTDCGTIVRRLTVPSPSCHLDKGRGQTPLSPDPCAVLSLNSPMRARRTSSLRVSQYGPPADGKPVLAALCVFLAQLSVLLLEKQQLWLRPGWKSMERSLRSVSSMFQLARKLFRLRAPFKKTHSIEQSLVEHSLSRPVAQSIQLQWLF
jgi:hypothetical protein